MSVTLIIIIITVAISVYAFNNQSLWMHWMMNPYEVLRKKQFYRFLTSGFIHSDYTHLGFNMLTLYFFGNKVQYYLAYKSGGQGAVIFILFYLLAIVVSEIPTYFKHKENPNYNSLGASGGVSAVVFASIMIDPVGEIYLYFAIGIPGFILGILYLIYSYFMSKKGRDNINHDAHFYGAVFGVLFIILMDPGATLNFIKKIIRIQKPFVD